jgi:hypothetical protein
MVLRIIATQVPRLLASPSSLSTMLATLTGVDRLSRWKNGSGEVSGTQKLPFKY